MALGLSVANDIASAALPFHIRGVAFKQTMQKKPLLKVLDDNKMTFPGGKDNITEPVQGQFMSDTAGFEQGYSEDDAVNFSQSNSLLRTSFPWKEVSAGLIITWTELKKDGITIVDHQVEKEHSKTELIRLTGILQNRLDDFTESLARARNLRSWQTGIQDSKTIPGIKALLTDVNNAGVTGGLNRATYPWWQHRTLIGANKITASGPNQTLTKILRSELRQLRRFGGEPSVALCGSGFIDALEIEVAEKGIYTQEGFANNGKNDMGMADIRMTGLGVFTYDPTLDDLGEGKRCYILDPKHIKWRPMEGEENKTLTPERPYNYMVFLKNITNTGAITANQLNCHGMYEV